MDLETIKLLSLSILFILITYFLNRGVDDRNRRTGLTFNRVTKRVGYLFKSRFSILIISLLGFNISLWAIFIAQTDIDELTKQIDGKHSQYYYHNCHIHQEIMEKIAIQLNGSTTPRSGEVNLKDAHCPYGGGQYYFNDDNQIECKIHGSYHDRKK